MPLAHRFTAFLDDLQRIEKTRGDAGSVILDAFIRHTPCLSGAVYLRDSRELPLRLAAKSQQMVAPEILDFELPAEIVSFPDHLFVPLRTAREHLGVVKLAQMPDVSEDDLDIMRAAATYVTTLMTNQRLTHEMREGDFQLKYRLWELESLYEIGLSIAATLNIDELADEILFRTISLTNSRRAALFLREGDLFKVYRSFGDVKGEFLDEDLARQVVEQGAPVSFEEGVDCIFPGCLAFVALPIKGNNETIGVLAAADRETREGGLGTFEANDLRLLSSFASQVSIALENARLHQ